MWSTVLLLLSSITKAAYWPYQCTYYYGYWMPVACGNPGYLKIQQDYDNGNGCDDIIEKSTRSTCDSYSSTQYSWGCPKLCTDYTPLCEQLGCYPTSAPTVSPIAAPTDIPSTYPTMEPSDVPTTATPSDAPSDIPSTVPTTAAPNDVPSDVPTAISAIPTAAIPTTVPTAALSANSSNDSSIGFIMGMMGWILFGLLLFGLVVFVCWRKWKKRGGEVSFDEKYQQSSEQELTQTVINN
eukprot:246383_1